MLHSTDKFIISSTTPPPSSSKIFGYRILQYMVLLILRFIINIPEINIVWYTQYHCFEVTCILWTAILQPFWRPFWKKWMVVIFCNLWKGSATSIRHEFDAKIPILSIPWHKTRQNSWSGYTLAAILDFCQTGSCTTCTPCENQTCLCVDWYPQVSWNPHKVQFSSDIEPVAPKLSIVWTREKFSVE